MFLVILLTAALFSSEKENGWKIMAEANKPHPIVKVISCDRLRLPLERCIGFSIEW